MRVEGAVIATESKDMLYRIKQTIELELTLPHPPMSKHTTFLRVAARASLSRNLPMRPAMLTTVSK